MRSIRVAIALLSFVLGCSTVPSSTPTAAPPAAGPAVAPTAPAAASAPATIKVGLVAGTGASPVFVAKGLGYFDKQNLDVQFVTVSSGAELLPLMASNQLDARISRAKRSR